MTEERTPESGAGRAADVDPTFDPAPVFGEAAPAVHPGHPALRRALDHAPDRGSEPDDELRQAIRSFAHESAAPSLPSGRTGLLGRRGGSGATGLEARTNARRSRLWRNLIVAAVLVVIVATVTLHREPGPGGGRPATTAPEAVVAPAESSAPAVPAASAPVAVATANAPASAAAGVPRTAAPTLSEAEKLLFAPRVTPPPAAPAPTPASTVSPAPASSKVATPSTPSTPSATLPAAPPKASTSALPSAATPVPGTPAGTVAERANNAIAPAPASAPALPSATAPGGRAVASFAAPGSPATPPATAATAPPATAAKPAAEAPPPPPPPPPGPPTFAALSQWTQLTMTRADGSTRRRSKPDVRELGALLSSAALSGAGAEPIKGRVDWRVSLERNGQTLARVELAGNQVRWIENSAAPGTGTPPDGALDSVREMLENVFEEPAPGAAPRPAPVPVEVQNR